MILKSKDYLIFVFMYKIEYEIGLNEQGRPYIGLPEDYDQKPEDRFFALEITRWMLVDLLNRNKDQLDNPTIDAIDEAERLLGQIGDETAAILYEGMRAQGEMRIMMDAPYHIEVIGIEARDALPDKDIIYMDRIYDRIEGLKVYVNFAIEDWDEELAGVYELKNGITNEHWIKL